MARVLVIDDDDMLREVHAELLDSAGHQTMQAATGVAGLEAIRSARPDLVLCDVAMPGMDGYAVLEAVRADPRIASTPFLFVTGLDPRHHFRAAMSLGADDYLAKPVSQDDLVAAVEARLARHTAERRESERRVEELRRSVTFLLPHELRTPLTIILGASQMIQELHQEMSPEEIGEIATTISKAAQRLHRMAENYLLQPGWSWSGWRWRGGLRWPYPARPARSWCATLHTPRRESTGGSRTSSWTWPMRRCRSRKRTCARSCPSSWTTR